MSTQGGWPSDAGAPPMTPAHAEAEIARVEAAHDLLRHTVDGWCAWPLLRLGVGKRLQGLTFAPQVPPGRGQRLRAAAGDLAGAARLGRSDYLVKSYVSGLADREGGRYRDVWFHELLDALPDAVKIDGVNTVAFLPRRTLACHPSVMTTGLMDLATGALTRLRPPSALEAAAAAIARALESEFGPGRFPLEWVRAPLLRFHWTRRAYVLLLSRVRPRWVFTADPGEHALAAAARERGARVLELQHGLVYGAHHGYGWTEYALPYRDRMPLPHRMLVYGEHWRRELAAGGFWGDALRVVGSLRMDAFRARRPPSRGGRARTLLVTSQGIDTERVAAFLATFLAGEPDPELRLVVKLHPAYEQRDDVYRAALGGDPRASIVSGSGESTFDLLLGADLHLSVSSTCHYEALGLGVPTAVLPFATHEIVAPLCAAGHATLLAGADHLRALLSGEGPPVVGADVSAYYFQPGALENLRALLARDRDGEGEGA